MKRTKRTKESLKKEMELAIYACDFLKNAKKQGISPKKCTGYILEIYSEIMIEYATEMEIQFFTEWVTKNLNKDSFDDMPHERSSGSFQTALLGFTELLEDKNHILDCKSEEDFTGFLEELSEMADEERMRFD